MQNTVNIPPVMKAVIQEKSGANLTVKEVEVPVPSKGQVLVKMSYAPVNPSDLSKIGGTMAPLPHYPYIPGLEGSGRVVKAGPGLLPFLRSGKTVACSPAGRGGTWAEYMLTTATNCIVLDKKADLMQGAMLIVNPMTALALTGIIKKKKIKTVVNNAAAGAVGQMLISLCNKEGIRLINIVRKEEQVNILKAKGAEIVLNSSSTEFVSELRDLSLKYDAGLFLDAVGGQQTTNFIESSPPGSEIMLYANLSGLNFSADTRDILQHGKIISGFSLPLYMERQNLIKLIGLSSKAKNFIRNSFKTPLSGTYRIEEINKAIDFYKDNMSAGKVLLSFED